MCGMQRSAAGINQVYPTKEKSAIYVVWLVNEQTSNNAELRNLQT